MLKNVEIVHLTKIRRREKENGNVGVIIPLPFVMRY